MSAKRSVLWLTNHQAPYREPLWAELSRRCQLRVWFLHAYEPQRHWRYQPQASYDSRVANTRRLFRRSTGLGRDPFVWTALAALIAAVRNADAIVVGGWDDIAYLQAMATAAVLHKTLVIFYESTSQSHRFSGGPVAGLRRVMFRRADSVLTPGTASSDAVRGFGVESGRIFECGNAIDVGRFDAGIRALRHSMTDVRDVGSGTHRFLYVGQLIERKNVGALLDALAEVDRGVSLTIAGDGPDEQELERQVRDLGLEDRVTFAGHVTGVDLDRLLAVANTLVLPSKEEVYGFVVVEALASGLQVVVSERAGIAASLTDVEQAICIPPTVDGIHSGMETAIKAWTGYHPRPRQLLMEPADMADRVMDCLSSAQLSRRSRVKTRQRRRLQAGA